MNTNRGKKLIDTEELERRCKAEKRPTPMRVLEIMEEMYGELKKGD